MDFHPATGQKLKVERKFAVCWGPIEGISDAVYVIVEVEAKTHPGHTDPVSTTFYLVSPMELISKPSFLVEEPSTDPAKKPKKLPKFVTRSTVEEARSEVEQLIRWEFQFQIRKGHLPSFTEEDVQAKLLEVQEVLLP